MKNGSYVCVKPCIALDSLCFLEKRTLDRIQWMNEKQIEEIKYINSLLPSDFGHDHIGMSNICLIVSACIENDLDALTIDDLIELFKNPKTIEKSVKEKIKKDDFRAYIYQVLPYLNDGYADDYIKKLEKLKSIDFENLYRERIMPLVNEEISEKEKEIARYDTKELFKNISVLKNIDNVGTPSIYISFFSAPTAFSLYGGSFLACFCPPNSIDYYSLMAHENMHGFASKELTELYIKHTESNDFLKARHKALIEDYHSGDEEELVLAAEYYLSYLAGIFSKDELIKRAEQRYGGCCSTSVVIFKLLVEEKEIPKNYNKWLTDLFKENKII
ncbi:MAG: hypothetical protein J6B60_06155 [Clostridia bacterium]|nr:hypothetical protein [Clostridia bacterium]